VAEDLPTLQEDVMPVRMLRRLSRSFRWSALGSARRRLLIGGLCLSLTFSPVGCTRKFFRTKTDKEVDALLHKKGDHPLWKIESFPVYPDPRARFADPTNPDRPPMPPDDPGAYDAAPRPQKPGKEGIAYVEGTGYLELLAEFDRENRARLAAERAGEEAVKPDADRIRILKHLRENYGILAPEVELQRELASPVPRPPNQGEEKKGAESGEKPPTIEETAGNSGSTIEAGGPGKQPYLIGLDQAVELGLINSREYQDRRESLYLAALPVTLERFSFGPQWFAAGQTFREYSGRETPEGFRDRLRSEGVVGFTKLLATGGQILGAIANTTIINMGGPANTSVSTLTLDLIQPLLRGGGRAVTLEPLTQAERNLLYAVRDFFRFRQEFFVFIAAGQQAFIPGQQAGVSAITPGTVSTPGAFVPGSAPLAAPGTSVPGRPVITPGAGGRLFPTGVPGANPQGFLGTLVAKYMLINQYENIVTLQRFLDLFRVLKQGGFVAQVQVGNVEQNLLGDINQVLSAQASYRADLDQLKLQLGLPLTVDLDLVDEPLRPVLEQTERYERLSEQVREVRRTVQNYGQAADVEKLRGRLRATLSDSRLTRGTEFRTRALERWKYWEGLQDGKENSPFQQKLEEIGKELRALLARRDELEPLPLPENQQRRLAELEFELTLGEFELDLRGYEQKAWESLREPLERAARQQRDFRVVIRSFLLFLESAVRERQQTIRTSWPVLPPACVEGVDLLREDEDQVLALVYRTALANRVDLMNRRAQLVDSWRKIAVASNALLGVFNVEYHLEAFTPPNGAVPLAFGGSRTRHQLILGYDLPLVRIEERNNYRGTLIAYQQQRRDLMLAEDQLLFAVRLELRQLRVGANQYYRIRQRDVELAYLQVDQALEAFEQPQEPAGALEGRVGPPGAGGRGDPAALTNQLLNAQSALLRSKNSVYNAWIGYISSRMRLYRNLGLMPLNSRGVWIDVDATCECDSSPTPRPEPGVPRDERGPDLQRPEELPPPRRGAPSPPAPLPRGERRTGAPAVSDRRAG
jgi:hypothetical protein